MPRKIVAGNWKMNTTLQEALDLATAVRDGAQQANAELILCPPFPFLEAVSRIVKDSAVKTGAQNCAATEKGAFTGEVSASMIASVAAQYVIIGHSERRSFFGEDDQLVKNKVIQAFKQQLKVIFCCGETLEEREAGLLEEVVSRQIQEGLPDQIENPSSQLIIAYEPVWAIGTGKTATPAQAAEAHAMIRRLVLNRFAESGKEISILYGGSCNASNAAELFSQPNIDGGLIGGASLKAEDFLIISRSFS